MLYFDRTDMSEEIDVNKKVLFFIAGTFMINFR